MNTFKKTFTYLIFGVIIVGIIVYYSFLIYKKTHSGIVLSCGVIEVPLSTTFTALARPLELKGLDRFGCYEALDGCACAKLSPDGEGIAFGVSKTDPEELKIPTDTEEQKVFLASLGDYVKANSATGTLVTSKSLVFKDNPAVAVKSLLTDSSGKVVEARNIYFLHKNNLINITFQTEQNTFARYWPDIEKSLNVSSFK